MIWRLTNEHIYIKVFCVYFSQQIIEALKHVYNSFLYNIIKI